LSYGISHLLLVVLQNWICLALRYVAGILGVPVLNAIIVLKLETKLLHCNPWWEN